VQRRHARAVFNTVIEIRGFDDWVVHEDVERAVDAYILIIASHSMV
jgi:hypothetical protein